MKPAASWLALCTLFAALSLIAWPFPREALDWQPAVVATQPWRTLTAAFVHWTPLHLAANLAGGAVLALLGWRAAFGPREALAGLIALPLTQAGLLLRLDLLRYAGLSGALHALVAVAALTLLVRGGRERLVGVGIALGLIVKLVMEQPFGPALRITPGFDFPVAPFAHFSGALAGAIAWGLTMRHSKNTPKRPSHGT